MDFNVTFKIDLGNFILGRLFRSATYLIIIQKSTRFSRSSCAYEVYCVNWNLNYFSNLLFRFAVTLLGDDYADLDAFDDDADWMVQSGETVVTANQRVPAGHVNEAPPVTPTDVHVTPDRPIVATLPVGAEVTIDQSLIGNDVMGPVSPMRLRRYRFFALVSP